MTAIRSNAWITLESSLAAHLYSLFEWNRAGQPDPEPQRSAFDDRVLRKLVDIPWSASCFKPATISALAPKTDWVLWSVYDIQIPEWIDAGYNQYGKAQEGGDLGVAGVWYWEPSYDSCRYDESGEYPWKPNQVIAFMPDECADPDCAATIPATTIHDVSLLSRQPPRTFPAQPTTRRYA